MLIFLTFLFLMLFGCSFSSNGGFFECNDEIKNRVDSPSQDFEATVFQRDCGATTAISTIVVLRHESETFNSERKVIFIIKGTNNIQLKWLNEKLLYIEYCPGEVFARVTRFYGVNIRYQLFQANLKDDSINRSRCANKVLSTPFSIILFS